MSETFWQLTDTLPRFDSSEFHAAVDLARPGDGLTEVLVAGRRLAAARLLGIAAPAMVGRQVRPSENYVRGPDLVVAYEESGQWPVRVDAVWRATAPTAADNFWRPST